MSGLTKSEGRKEKGREGREVVVSVDFAAGTGTETETGNGTGTGTGTGTAQRD